MNHLSLPKKNKKPKFKLKVIQVLALFVLKLQSWSFVFELFHYRNMQLCQFAATTLLGQMSLVTNSPQNGILFVFVQVGVKMCVNEFRWSFVSTSWKFLKKCWWIIKIFPMSFNEKYITNSMPLCSLTKNPSNLYNFNTKIPKILC